MTILFLLGVFVATVSLFVGVYLWIDQGRLAAVETAKGRFKAHVSPRDLPKILRDMRVSELAVLERLLDGRAITARLEYSLRMAGVSMRPGKFLSAVAIAALCGIIVGSMGGFPLAMLGLAAGAYAPFSWLGNKRRRRRLAFEDQLPEAIDMLVSATRAGYSLQMAMKFIGDELAAPLGPEFTRFYDEQRLGMDVRAALLSLQARIDSTDLKMFVTALLVQRDTGGNLAEVLGNIADVIRQRGDMHRQIDTLTAESKMSARILAALPMLAFGAILFLDPQFLQPMIVQPMGRFMLAYATLSVVIGYWLLMKMARIDF
ncbi:MAG: hypothetical protein JWM41_704 [Gemmatimonadetes bacterium]|nr:hypothetical protein [Gemmatimonadota bacterium]